MFITIIIVIVLACVFAIRPINKEKYMDDLKGLNTNKYMGVGVLALTNNKVDIMFVIICVLTIVGYVGYNMYMDHRAITNKQACMKRAMVDYSYSSHLVRIMDKEG